MFFHMRSKEKMSKRERVETAMDLKETDRVPLYDLLLNDAVIEHYAGKFPGKRNEDAKTRLKAIGETLDMTRCANFIPFGINEHVKDMDGIVTNYNRWMNMGIIKRPFNDEKGGIEWIKSVNKRLAKETKEIDLKTIRESHRDEFIKTQSYIGDDTVVMLYESGPGLDWIRAPLGLELFSYISIDEPGLISEYIELYTNMEIMKCHAIADKDLSPCIFTYCDIAYKGSLLHSPDWLRKEIFPQLKKIQTAWHEHDIKCLFHSDGFLMEIMDDLIDTGIDGLNPIEIGAGMKLEEIKKKYGESIFLTGGIDMSQLLARGTSEEVREVCRRAIRTSPLGYFMGSTSEIDHSAKTQNVIAMFETAWSTYF